MNEKENLNLPIEKIQLFLGEEVFEKKLLKDEIKRLAAENAELKEKIKTLESGE